MQITKLQSNKFKTNLVALFITVPLTKENCTKNALLTSVLRRGTNNLKTQEEISKRLEELYGAGFNCGVDKLGNYHVLKFYLETLENTYTLNNENLLQEGVNLLLDIVFNPFVEDNGFNKVYVEQEKLNLQKLIESRKDNKALYAKERCLENMFSDESYALYKYGLVEDLTNINEINLYAYYKELLKNCKIDLYVTGNNIDDINLPEIQSKNLPQIENLHVAPERPNKIYESQDITQGKLIIGLDIDDTNKPAISMYNTILGGGANSKLFQNVREKASLAYSAGSSYIRRKNVILIQTGIEIENYDKAVKIIEEQLQDMKNGKITDEEYNSAKQLIVSSIELIEESKEDMITFYFDQNLFAENLNVTEYKEMIKKVTKDDVIKIAQKVKEDTIYFLTNNAKWKGAN